MRDLSFLWKRFRWPWRSMFVATLVVGFLFGSFKFFDMAVPWFFHTFVWFIAFLHFFFIGLDKDIS